MSIKGEGKEESRTGFAGLSSMVSDVDATVTRAEKTTPAPSAGAAPAPRTRPAPQPQPQPAKEPEPDPEAPNSINWVFYQQPAHPQGAHQQAAHQQAAHEPPGGVSPGKWLLGIGVVIGFIWLLSESGNKSSPPASAYSPSNQSSLRTTPVPSWQPPQGLAQPQVPSRPPEEQPPAGTNHVLGPSQIRYCLAEAIRLDAAKGALNNYVESDVYQFNAMIADYNSRCGQFRYRKGSLETVRSEIEAMRAVLQAEGSSRFASPNYSLGGRQSNPSAAPGLPITRAQEPAAIASSSKPPKAPPLAESPRIPADSGTGRPIVQPERFASFMQTVRSGTADDVEAMVRNGADVNMRIQGTTPIIEAVKISNIGTATVLLEAGADPNSVDRDDQTALDYAKLLGDTVLASLLKAHGAVGHK